MANIGSAVSGKTLIGAGIGQSANFADIGTNSGLTAHGVLLAQGNSAFSAISPGTLGYVLTAQGNADPIWAAIPPTVDYHTARFIVSPNGNADGANYTSIQSAINAAVLAGGSQTIVIQPGTYTENITLASGVNLYSYNNKFVSGPVNILGKLSDSGGGVSCTFGGITFITNSDYILSLSNSSVATFNNCYFRGTNHTIINAGSSSTVNIYNSVANLETTLISLYDTTGGTLFFQYCVLSNPGNSTTTGTLSNGSATFRYCTITCPLATTSTGVISCTYCQFGTVITPYINQTWLTTAGTVSSFLLDCKIYSGTASAVSIGSGTTIEMYNCIVNSSNASAIAGAGTLKYNNISFTGSSSTIAATTQTPKVYSNDAITVVNPGAVDYTIITQDALILADSSGARNITLPASPTTGEKHIIKDTTGTAATNNITILGNGKNIDGAASTVINVNYGSVTIVFNGTQWVII